MQINGIYEMDHGIYDFSRDNSTGRAGSRRQGKCGASLSNKLVSEFTQVQHRINRGLMGTIAQLHLLFTTSVFIC